jgi:soluble lytic murein transglycosylase
VRFDLRNPPKAAVIAVLVAISIGFGFLFDFLCTCVEKHIYPLEYAEYVERYATQYGVPPEAVFALIKTESGFDSAAVSDVGAIGLTQLMPDTFRWLTDEILFDHLDDGMIYDPETNVRYGTYYLSRLYDQFGSWKLAFAAYNAGPGRVIEWLEDDRYADGEGGLKKIPITETRRHVKKSMDAMDVYERLYGERYASSEEKAA